MASFKFGKGSQEILEGVHPDLQLLANETIKDTPYDFGITSGVRTPAEQLILVANKKSKTLDSRHLTGHAIDIVVYVHGVVTWDIKHYRKVVQAFVTKAIELGIQVEFGALWASLVDGPHIELNRKHYHKDIS